MANDSAITTSLAVDAALEQDADFAFDSNDRQYIDSQVRGCQQHLVDCLISSKLASWYSLDTSSAAVVAGDTVCLSSALAGTVTKSTAAKLLNAGIVIGVVLRAASAGARVLVATFGSIVPASITELATSAAGYVRVNASTSRPERVTKISSSDYLLGTVDTFGNLFISPSLTNFVSGANTWSEGDIIPDPVTTTDATVTTFYSATLATSGIVHLCGKISCKKANASVYGAWSVEAFIENNAGTLTQRAAAPVTEIADSSSIPGVTVDVSGTTYRVRVQGIADTLVWSGRLYAHVA